MFIITLSMLDDILVFYLCDIKTFHKSKYNYTYTVFDPIFSGVHVVHLLSQYKSSCIWLCVVMCCFFASVWLFIYFYFIFACLFCFISSFSLFLLVFAFLIISPIPLLYSVNEDWTTKMAGNINANRTIFIDKV